MVYDHSRYAGYWIKIGSGELRRERADTLERDWEPLEAAMQILPAMARFNLHSARMRGLKGVRESWYATTEAIYMRYKGPRAYVIPGIHNRPAHRAEPGSARDQEEEELRAWSESYPLRLHRIVDDANRSLGIWDRMTDNERGRNIAERQRMMGRRRVREGEEGEVEQSAGPNNQ